MLKTLTTLLLLAPVAAQAFTKCDLTDIGGPGATIVEEASNPVMSGLRIYAAFAQGKKIQVLVARKNGATQQALQTAANQSQLVSSVRLAAAGDYVYATWLQGAPSGPHLFVTANGKHGNAGAWGTPVDLGEVRHALQQISADGNNVHIAYMRTDGHTGILSSADNARTFTAPADLGSSVGEIVVASLGPDVYVAWELGRQTTTPSVQFAVSHDSGAHFAVKSINGTRHAHEPILSLNQKSGRLSLVWREDAPQIGTYLQSNDHGDSWSTPLTIDDTSRQFMIQDAGDKIYISYLKDYTINSTKDWQVQLAISSDGGKTFPEIHNLSGPTGISAIIGDKQRPVTWAGRGEVRITGVAIDGVRIWSGYGGKINAKSVYLGPGELASPQGNAALWQAPEGMVTYAYCH